MERSARRRNLMAAAWLVLVVALLGTTSRSRKNAAAQDRNAASQAPVFEVDPLWPKPLPNHWVLGSIGGIGVDEQDHVWILNRGSRTLADNFKQLEMNPPWAMCCASAPAVLEFDQAGNLLRHWGGFPGGPGYEWFDQEHGLAIDFKGNVWIGGGTGGDSHILKFTKDGKFLMQIGKRNARLVSEGGSAAPAAGGRGTAGGRGPARVFKA